MTTQGWLLGTFFCPKNVRPFQTVPATARRKGVFRHSLRRPSCNADGLNSFKVFQLGLSWRFPRLESPFALSPVPPKGRRSVETSSAQRELQIATTNVGNFVYRKPDAFPPTPHHHQHQTHVQQATPSARLHNSVQSAPSIMAERSPDVIGQSGGTAPPPHSVGIHSKRPSCSGILHT